MRRPLRLDQPTARFLLAVLAALCLMSAACAADRTVSSKGVGSGGSVSSRGHLRATPDRRDVGSVSQLHSVVATYCIANEGDQAVRILNVVCV